MCTTSQHKRVTALSKKQNKYRQKMNDMSKNVDKVKEVIKAHLDAMAQKDACFAEK